MAKSKSSPRSGKGLTKKVGPFPAYVYLIGVVIVVLYLYSRHRKNSAQTSVAATGGYSQPTPSSGVDVVPSGNASQPGTTTQGSDPGTVQFPTDYATQTDLQDAIDSIDSSTTAAIAGITFPNPTINITVPAEKTHQTTTKSKQAAHKATPSSQPFGGVLRTTKTKTGAVITYYRSGRVVEKLPGKSAYVVHK